MATPTLALAGPTGDQPAVAEERSAPDDLESLLVVRAEMEGGDAVAEVLREDVLAALRAAGVASTLPEGASLEVVVSSDANTLGAYEVVYLYQGAVLDSWSCACSGEELRLRLSGTAPDAWRAAVAAGAPVATPEPAAAPEPVAVDPKSGHAPPRPGLWIGGVSTLASSTVLIGAGSVLLILDGVDHVGPSPGAIGLLVGGVATAATGAVLLGLAHRKRKRAHVAAGARIGKGVVVTVEGRF